MRRLYFERGILVFVEGWVIGVSKLQTASDRGRMSPRCLTKPRVVTARVMLGLCHRPISPSWIDLYPPSPPMAHPAAPTSLDALNKFKFVRILNEDPLTHSITLLGNFPERDGLGDVPAIVRVEKTALNVNDAPHLFGERRSIRKVVLEESTDIVRFLTMDSALLIECCF